MSNTDISNSFLGSNQFYQSYQYVCLALSHAWLLHSWLNHHLKSRNALEVYLNSTIGIVEMEHDFRLRRLNFCHRGAGVIVNLEK